MKKFISLNSRVSSFFSSNELVIVDEKNRVLYFDEFKLKKGLKLKLSSNRPDENGVKFSYDGKYLLVAVNKYLTLWDLEKKDSLGTFLSKSDILSVGFSKDNKYFALGNLDGEIYVYNFSLKKRVYKLKRHKDFITDITFYEDKSYIVAGGYDKSVIFYNFMTLEKEDKYYHLNPVKRVEKDNYLISIDSLSTFVNWDSLKKDFKDVTKFYKEFRDFCLYKDYLVIGTKNNIIIYNLDKSVIENENFLQVDNIYKITIYKHYLIIALENGDIYYRNLFEEEKELLDLIIKEDYKKAYELIYKNPFLKFSKGYEKLKKIIELQIKRAKELFLEDEVKAIKILNKFLVIPFLRSEIEKIIEDFKNYKKFVFAIKKKNYSLAYLLANRYPSLKETKYYKLLERTWEVTFEKAKKLALDGKLTLAKKLLEPFMSVNEKLPLIKLLLKKAHIFLLLREKISKKDFRGFFEIIKNHPELKNSKEYKKVLEYAKTIYDLALKSLKNEDFKRVKRIALILKDIEGYEDKAIELLKKVENSLKFLNLLSLKEYKKAFEMVERYPYLKELKSYKEFLTEYNLTYEKVEELLSKNKFQEARELVKKFKEINKLKGLNEC